MSEVGDLLSISGHVLLVVYLAGGLLALFRVPLKWRPLLMLGTAWLGIVPFGRTSLVGLSRGVLGDLSLSMQALLLIGVFRIVGMRHPLLRPWRRDAAFGMFLVETALILSTLGILPFDLYGLGYAPQTLLIVLLATMVGMWRAEPACALALLAGCLAFAVGGMASPNLWDYLIDPLILAPCFLRIFSFRNADSPQRIAAVDLQREHLAAPG
ncbi:MAG: hypothetical protein K2X38_01340 [Gemmataceae bacterium]|nr:hypothetical protein [Gemmataceae bacterium]